jgi:methylated-DNA-[protein]-cysteine S-methyltransferase
MDKSPILIGSIQTTRLGEVWVAISEHGLMAVEFGIFRKNFEAAVRQQTDRDVEYKLKVAESRSLAEVTHQIKEYLEGKRRAFEIKIDWSILTTDFQRAALRAVFSIPYGQTRTYAQVAAGIGHPDAPRAVGRANATNPMPLVIPCHRVIGTDGKLHGYGGAGGLKTKAWLLKMEGAKY